MPSNDTTGESAIRRMIREGAVIRTVTLEDQGIQRTYGQCEYVMKRPPVHRNRVVAVGSRHWRRDDGKAWKRQCPNRATVLASDKRYCEAHAPA